MADRDQPTDTPHMVGKAKRSSRRKQIQTTTRGNINFTGSCYHDNDTNGTQTTVTYRETTSAMLMENTKQYTHTTTPNQSSPTLYRDTLPIGPT